MKKLFILLMLLPFLGFSQKLKLSPNGFVNSTDSTKNYIVLDFEGKSKSDLYKASQLYFSKIYVNPKEVMTLIDGESITLNGIDKQAIKMKFLYLNPSWDVNYTSNYEFKDNKVKVSIHINRISAMVGSNPPTVKNSFDFFNKKGVLTNDKGAKSVEDYFNSVLDKYIIGINAKNDNW